MRYLPFLQWSEGWKASARSSGLSTGQLAMILSALLLASIVVQGSGVARTWHVPGDAPTIQGGIDLAQAGDDVLVGPGLYPERNILLKGGVWVHSEQGPTETIVDAGGAGRGFDCVDQQDMATLEGFGIQHGHATGDVMEEQSGGGIRGIASQLTVRDCVITGCSSTWAGGGIGAFDSCLDVEGCWVTGCSSSGIGGGLYSWGEPSVRIVDCRIFENWADSAGGIDIGTLVLEMTGCEVSRNDATWGSGGGVVVSYAAIVMRGCLIADNGAYMTAARQLGMVSCSGLIDACTVAGGQGGCAITFQTSDIQVDRTIIAFNWEPVDCDGSNIRWHCCDVYGNSGGDDVCGDDLGGNFSADPRFCDAANGDYTLDSASPCLPGNHPNGIDCGLIGALGAGCGTPPIAGACCLLDGACVVVEPQDCEEQSGVYIGDGSDCEPNPCGPTAVERTTWGRIRQKYR